MTTFTLVSAAWNSVLARVPVKDASREYLLGVHVTSRCIEATDGHALARWTYAPDAPDADHGIYSFANVGKLKPRVEYTFALAEDGARLTGGGCAWALPAIDGVFPDADRVIPAEYQDADAAALVGFNAAYMASICQTFDALQTVLGWKGRLPEVHMRQGGAGKVFVLTAPVAPQLLVLLMPMRL